MPATSSVTPKLILILLSLIALSFQQCTLSNSNDLLQSGSSLLYNANSASREHLFTVSTNFNVPSSGLQVAASVSSLQITVTGGIDFSVRGLAGQSYGSVQLVLLIDEDNSWTSIRVSYLLSGRSDFYLGSYVADIYLASKYSNSVNIQVNVPNWTSSQGPFTAIAQFAGVKTASNSFSISFSTLSFNPSSGVISLTIAMPVVVGVENIYITYIILRQNSPISYTAFNPIHPSTGTYTFVGLDIIRSTGSTFAGSAFTSTASTGLNCVGSGCQTSCISAQACTASGGQISGNTCYLCATGQIVINGNCQSSNRCGQNQYWTGSQCVCTSGYTLVNGVCFQMCGTNAYIINNQCVCLPGYTYSTSTNQCTSQTSVTCGTNFVVINGNCVCPARFGIINNLCLTCPFNSYVNSIGNCQCIAGYVLSSTTLSCVSQNNCFPNSTPNSLGQCVCNNGYYNQGNQCIPQTTCQNGMVYNGVSCVCPTGQYTDAITGQCTYCNNYGQAVQGNSCVCSPTFYPTSSGCAPCTANSVYNSATKQCACLTGYTLTNGQCVSSPTCPPNSMWNAVTSSCRCLAQGHYIINNVCAQCPPNSQWNGSSCQCYGNFVMSGNSCVPACASGSTWNGVSCVCSGVNIIGGPPCTCPDPNSLYNASQAACICNNGYYGNWQKCYNCDSSCATCTGPANSQCTSCSGTNTLNNNGGCSAGCGAGQYVSPSNNCLPCMSNCVLCYSGDSCTTCANGYSKSLSVVNGNIVIVCNAVPTGTSSKLSLRSYVVGNNVIYQGVAMSLMPTQILADGCTICDSLLLVKIVSTYASATATVSYVANSQYWFLITFDFTGAAFIPTFQFTVQINPTYATYFTSADMVQKLVSAISPETTYQTQPTGQRALVRPTFTAAGSATAGSAAPLPASSNNQILLKVFAV